MATWNERCDADFQEATALRDAGKLAEARGILERLGAEHPDVFAVWLVLGGLQFDQEDFTAAETSLLVATHLRPKSELASVTLFHTLLHLGRTEDAFAEMRRFLAVRPESHEYELLREELSERD